MSCHCGFKEHCAHLKAKKLGFVGVILMGLHFLYHVAECLILPAILVAAGQGATEAAAAEQSSLGVPAEVEETTCGWLGDCKWLDPGHQAILTGQILWHDNC